MIPSWDEHRRLAEREQAFLEREVIKDRAYHATFEAALPKIDNQPLTQSRKEFGQAIVSLCKSLSELNPKARQLETFNLLETKLAAFVAHATDMQFISQETPELMKFLDAHREHIDVKVRKKIGRGLFGDDLSKVLDEVRVDNRTHCGQLETEIKTIATSAEETKNKLAALKKAFEQRLGSAHTSSITQIEDELNSLLEVGRTAKPSKPFDDVTTRLREVWNALRDELVDLVPPEISDNPPETILLRKRKALLGLLGEDQYRELFHRALSNAEAALDAFTILKEYVAWRLDLDNKEERIESVKLHAPLRIVALEGMIAEISDDKLAFCSRLLFQDNSCSPLAGNLLRHDLLKTRFKITADTLWEFDYLLGLDLSQEGAREFVTKELESAYTEYIDKIAKEALNTEELRRQLTCIGKCISTHSEPVVELVLQAIEAKRPVAASKPPAPEGAKAAVTAAPLAGAAAAGSTSGPSGKPESVPSATEAAVTQIRAAAAAAAEQLEQELNAPALPPELPEADFEKLVKRLEKYHGLTREKAEEIARKEDSELIVSYAEELVPMLEKALHQFGKRIPTASHIFKAICHSPFPIYEWGTQSQNTAKFKALTRIVVAWESICPTAFIGMLAATEGRAKDEAAFAEATVDSLNAYAEFIEKSTSVIKITINPQVLNLNQSYPFFRYLASNTPVAPKTIENKTFPELMNHNAAAIAYCKNIIDLLAKKNNQTANITEITSALAAEQTIIRTIMQAGVLGGLFRRLQVGGDDYQLVHPRDVTNTHVKQVLLQYVDEDGRPRSTGGGGSAGGDTTMPAAAASSH